MKPINFVLVFSILIFGSCTTAQLRRVHDRELRTELSRHSDVLDLTRTEIRFSGRFYRLHGSAPLVEMYLHLKPNQNNRETVIMIRNGLIVLFDDSRKTLGKYSFHHDMIIQFLLAEDGEPKHVYLLRLSRFANGWFEEWAGYDRYLRPIEE